MISPQDLSFESIVRKSFAEGQNHHGDLQLSFEDYSDHIISITERHCGAPFRQIAAARFINALHLSDLFLSIACSHHSESAWERFTSLYRRHIFTWTHRACGGRNLSGEFAQNILTDLYLPDRTGKMRIASYNGRSSLAAWLQVIIRHRAINEYERRDNRLESLDTILDRGDETFFEKLNARVRASQFELITRDAFNSALSNLTPEEQLLILLRHEKGLQAAEIARSFGTSPSTLSRQLHSIYEKLRKEILSALAADHGLRAEAIEECIDDILENPAYSVLELIQME